jgi:hypothetical protein
MMKPLMKCTLLFISVLFLLPQHTIKACGFYVYPGEYRFWLLQPDLTNEKDLTPFYFATNYLYKGNQYAGREVYAQQNVNEWYEAVRHKALKKDIDELLYSTTPTQFFGDQKNLAKQNSFLQYLLQPSNRDLYRYFLLSKHVEEITANPDPWDERVFPIASTNAIIDSLQQLRRQTGDVFIRLRCAYQVIRLYNYNGQQDLVDRYYDAWIAPVNTKSWVKSAAFYQVAINYGGPHGNYLLSKVFDMGGYNRTHCLVRFSRTDLDSTLKLVKSRHERNVLLAMKVFNDPGRSLATIKQIYASEPGYGELPFLVLREINKVEDWLLTNKLTDFATPAVYMGDFWNNYTYTDNAAINYRNDKAYARQLSQFLHQMITDAKHPQKALLYLYAAYTDLLNGDYTGSSLHLQQASVQPHLPRNVKTQIAIHRFLLSLENGFDTDAEKHFLQIVQTADKELGLDDAKLMKSQLVLYTARKMIKKGDRARGLLLLGKTNRALGQLPISAYKTVYQEVEEHAIEQDYYTMLRIFSKKNKSPFERFVCDKRIHMPSEYYWWYDDSYTITWSRSKLMDGLASLYLRQHRLSDALNILKQLPDSFWKQSPYKEYIKGNPFYLNVYNAHPVTKDDKRDLNKVQVVSEMIHLETLAKKDDTKAAAECYYQLANAWYNMSWYGKNWLMVKQWWSMSEPDAYEVLLKKTAFNDDYYGCRQAKLYYERARNLTKDKKLAALCFFMEQNCDDNYTYYMKLVNKVKGADYNYEPDYALAKRKGIDVGYYKQVVEECETYLSFIMQYNQKH